MIDPSLYGKTSDVNEQLSRQLHNANELIARLSAMVRERDERISKLTLEITTYSYQLQGPQVDTDTIMEIKSIIEETGLLVEEISSNVSEMSAKWLAVLHPKGIPNAKRDSAGPDMFATGDRS